ncbi:hypothetical protein KSS87_017316, partial [Heliosperma pusillum]
RYLDYWRLESETKVDTFQKKPLKGLGIEVGYYKAYYAKEKALKMIYGEADEQYKRVWDYAETVKKDNEGSSVFVQLGNIEKPPPVFKRMYMCLDACKKGFLARCRPIIGVDGYHLKGPYPGQLLTEVSKDDNCNIYALASAIVEVENRDSWTWFLDLLVKDIEATLGNITFMSDRQKELVEAFATVVPNAEIRYCCRHIWSNFKLNWAREAYKQIFWKAAMAYTKGQGCLIHYGVDKKILYEKNVHEMGGADKEFKVEISIDERVRVNLDKKTCDYNKWELTGTPCAHVFACILKKRMDPESFVHEAYTKEMYKKTYSSHLKPLPGPKQWDKTDYLQPLPPPYKKQPARPSSKKRRNEGGENEGRQSVKRRWTKKTCSNCGQAGHSMKGCKNPDVSRPQQRKTKQRKTATTPSQSQNTQESSISDVGATGLQMVT